MVHQDSYVEQKLVIAVDFLNRGRDSLGKRVRRAWEEMSVLDVQDFDDEATRREYAALQATKELYVIEGETPKLTDARLDEVRRSILRIHDAVTGTPARRRPSARNGRSGSGAHQGA